MNFFHVQWGNFSHFLFIANGGLFHPNGDQFKSFFFKSFFFSPPKGSHLKSFFYWATNGGLFQVIFFSLQWGVASKDFSFPRVLFLHFFSSQFSPFQVVRVIIQGFLLLWLPKVFQGFIGWFYRVFSSSCISVCWLLVNSVASFHVEFHDLVEQFWKGISTFCIVKNIACNNKGDVCLFTIASFIIV